MDVTTAVRSDVLPAVGSFLIPGAIASAPYVSLAWGTPHHLKAFVDANQGISTAAGALLVVGAGLLVESIGTFVESHVVDKCHDNPKAIQDRWTEYLKIAWIREPVGQRYLRRVLTTFKFELNMLVATLATLPGIVVLGYYRVLPQHAVIGIVLIAIALLIYLWIAALEDSKLLHRLRGELITVARLQKVLEPPSM